MITLALPCVWPKILTSLWTKRPFFLFLRSVSIETCSLTDPGFVTLKEAGIKVASHLCACASVRVSYQHSGLGITAMPVLNWVTWLKKKKIFKIERVNIFWRYILKRCFWPIVLCELGLTLVLINSESHITTLFLENEIIFRRFTFSLCVFVTDMKL